MADAGFQQLRLPKLARVAFSDMTLYRRQRDATVDVDRPVFCLIGANGLGKSTFLTSVVYAMTGAVPDMQRAFQSAGEYLAETSRPDRVRDYFGGRLSEADRPLASITVTLDWGDGVELDVTRRLADGNAAVHVVDRSGLQENSVRSFEAEALYRERVTALVGIGDFAQFAFLVHFLMTFDEARHLLMWNDRVLTNALYLAFGMGTDTVALASDKQREIEREGSLSRNVRYAAKVVMDQKGRLADLLGDGAAVSTNELELKVTFDRLVEDVQRSEHTLGTRDTELRAAEVELADLASRVADLQIAYRQVFSNRLAASGTARFHPIVEETLRSDGCAVCGQTGARARVQDKLDRGDCPLCAADLAPEATDDAALSELRALDQRLTAERQRVEETGARRERLKRERAAAEDALAQTRSALAAFEEQHAAVAFAQPRDAAVVRQEMDRLDAEYAGLLRRSEEHRRQRDRVREDLREIEESLNARYQRASTAFVPRFRELAEAFIGLPIDIELDQRRGVEIAGFGLQMKMDDKLRLGPDRLSESQRFFIDIALRMALSEFMSPIGSMMLIDTPEGSLDIAYEARAGNMFDTYARAGNSIVMTANLRSSKLIERLAERSGESGMQVVRMTDWTDLTDVQLAEEGLFKKAYEDIEKALA